MMEAPTGLRHDGDGMEVGGDEVLMVDLILVGKGNGMKGVDRLDGRDFEEQTKEHIGEYADVGLRTLVLAYRELDEEEYDDSDCEEMTEEVAEKIERDLILLSAIAVEDKLQNEAVWSLIIKIWVLTGDKMDTAGGEGKVDGSTFLGEKIWFVMGMNYASFSEVYMETAHVDKFKTMEEVKDFKERFRASSVQLQDNECSKIVQVFLKFVLHHLVSKLIHSYATFLEMARMRVGDDYAVESENICLEEANIVRTKWKKLEAFLLGDGERLGLHFGLLKGEFMVTVKRWKMYLQQLNDYMIVQ
ncbi:unnamed protein product [Dovyalis caffra]|uniref:Uncharacterized protein n=1 Tax=Dovyalis caffra TaxID=77055 RepID=A0AAV1QSI4_9ROSI|nr:unnamed protein product [Dovyalis caffra]